MNKKKIIPIVILVTVVTASILYFEVFRHIDFNPSEIDGSGTIEVTEIDMASKMAGRITDLPFEEGDRVTQGQTIVKLAYEELAAQKLSAKATLDNMEKNFQRSESLFKTGSISKQAYDNALNAFSNAKSQFEYIMASIGNAEIVSPIAGVILRKNLEPGEISFPGSPIVVIGDLTKPYIKLYVSEKKIGMVKIGQKAVVTTDSFPGKKFTGKVTTISNKAEFTPKTIQTKEERVKLVFAVKILIENPSEELKPGMPADATIFTAAK